MNATLRIELGEEGADPERLDTLSSYLRDELRELDVEDVTALPAGPPPPGSRAIDVAAIGGLLVALGPSVQAIKPVVAAVIRWLGRGGGTRRTVRMEIGGETLELADASAADQARLVDMFVTRHSMTGGETWPAPDEP